MFKRAKKHLYQTLKDSKSVFVLQSQQRKGFESVAPDQLTWSLCQWTFKCVWSAHVPVIRAC